jgi:hypothetical protein
LSLREQSRQIAAQQAVLEQRQRELDQQAADLKAQTDELARRVQLPSETPAPLPQVSPTPQASAPVVFLTLSAGVTRSVGGSRTARLRPETSEVQLTLDLRDTSYPSYRATIINADRGEVFSRDGLRQQAARLTLRVPAKQLSPGDYYVSVYGGPANESVADYPVRINKYFKPQIFADERGSDPRSSAKICGLTRKVFRPRPGQSIEIALKSHSIVDVCDPCAQQIPIGHVWTRQPFTSHRTNFHTDHATGQMQREIQPVRAAAKSFVDDRRGQDHPESGRAEILGASKKDERWVGVLNVVVQNRQAGDKLNLAPGLEPAHSAAFD